MGSHRKLVRAMARLQAIKKRTTEARGELHEKASEQLDTMPQAIDTSAAYVARHKGGPLTYRYHKTRIHEAARLRAIVQGGETDD